MGRGFDYQRSSTQAFILTFLLLSLAVACRDTQPARIGDAYPRSEADSRFLAVIKSAVETPRFQVAGWSVKGNALGSLIQLNTEQATAFADDKTIVAVVGHSGSRDALLGAAVYNKRGVPNVIPNSTSRRLGSTGPWTFLMVPDDSVEGEFIARYAVDSLRAIRPAMLYVGDEYGWGLLEGVRAGLQRKGVDLLDATMLPNEPCFGARNEVLFESVVYAAIQRSIPDVVIITSGTVHGWCIADLIHAKSPQTWIVFTDGMDGARRPPPAEEIRFRPPHLNLARIRGVEFWAPGTDSLNREFIERVQRGFGRMPNASQALQYDAYMLLRAAVTEAGPDREAVRNWLESLGKTHKPWQGVTGPIAFNRPRSEILRMGGPVDSPQ